VAAVACLADAIEPDVAVAGVAAVAAAGGAAVASTRAAAAACAAVAAGTAAAVAAFLFATQTSLICFCRSLLRALAGHFLPCVRTRTGVLQKKSMRFLPSCILQTSMAQASVARHSW
jgi:hypothetical protein